MPRATAQDGLRRRLDFTTSGKAYHKRGAHAMPRECRVVKNHARGSVPECARIASRVYSDEPLNRREMGAKIKHAHEPEP